MQSIENFYIHDPVSGKKPEQLVILLHGLGSNGQDLISLAPFYARMLPDAVFVSPDAPFPCDMAPVGFQWFSLQSWSQEAFLHGVHTAAPILDSFIAEQMENYNLPADKVALVGFSQGTMMSLYTGPRFPEKLAGVLGYSGGLVWENDVDPASLQKVPVHLIHGDADPVVEIGRYYDAKDRLEAAGFKVSGGVTEGLMHNIDEEGILSGSVFLKDVLGV
jgi:phospholipase/carboxylesterase